MNFFATIGVVFLLLIISEMLWRSQRLHGEFSRKFVHITVGSFVAFWPYILSWREIQLLSLGFILMAAASKYFHIFKAIHSVQRPTWGEFWYALAVAILAFDTGHPHIFTAALLTMSLADGAAAIMGTKFGNSTRYVVFGAPKSVVGTLTFFVITLGILASLVYVNGITSTALQITSIAVVAATLENVAIHGLDNLAVPLFVAGILQLIS